MFPIAANRSDEENTTPYVDDVFSTTLYTGNGSTQTITNGIDLAGKGGLVWCKSRSSALSNMLVDTARGIQLNLSTDTTGAQSNPVNSITQFNNNGFNLGARTGTNDSAVNFASWTFRKAAKFFDVVTYTGNGVAGRSIAHSLGIAPGMIIVKCTTGVNAATANWTVYHKSLANTKRLSLNTTDAVITSATGEPWNSTDPTSTEFTVNSDYKVNAVDHTYVAYLFAHDTSSTGIIQCGSFTTDASGNFNVNLGWEPQYVMIKHSNAVSSNVQDNWIIYDTMRGFVAQSGNGERLYPNLSNAAVTGNDMGPTATGFESKGNMLASQTFIYTAIRRPNKPPTTGTQVFSPTVSTASTGTITSGFATDLVMSFVRPSVVTSTYNRMIQTRGMGKFAICNPQSGAVGSFTDTASFDSNTGVILNGNATYPSGYLHAQFTRASGYMDVVCYIGNETTRSINHNLDAIPELIISLNFGNYGTQNLVYHKLFGSNYYLYFSMDNAVNSYNIWNTDPTKTQFSLSSDYTANRSNIKFVALLFATLSGISKVGSYTGNGSSQNIDCGFAAGARFVLIKRTDSTGDWYIFDTARGIVTGNDPHLSLNTNVAEVTTDDSIDPYSPGFTVNQLAATNINVTSATYIFLAIA